MGKAITPGNSKLLSGPLGNAYIGFKGYILGKTTEDTPLNKDEDVKDIIFSQSGTKANDHVSTGQLLMVDGVFGEISTELLTLLVYSITSKAVPGVGDDSLTFGRFIYQSLRDSKAGPLRIWATDPDGLPIEDSEQDQMNFYEVVPIVNDNLVNWGADTQRNLPVTFMIYFSEFGDDAVIGGDKGAFGYMGDPTQELLPATQFPDLSGPQILTAEATLATNIDITYNENIALQGGAYTGGAIALINDAWVVPTGITVLGAVASVTLPAASVANGDDVAISLTDTIIEDTEVPANIASAISEKQVTNSVP